MSRQTAMKHQRDWSWCWWEVLRIRPLVMITPTWRSCCRCFRPVF
jgi:hypothetical protein